jgi:ABC-type nitrate/sulfonate/bicarbonate transport system substrate-binding protein
MSWNRLSKTLLFLVTTLGLASFSEAGRVKVAIPSETMAQIALYSGIENGYYAAEGLEVLLILMRAPVANLALIGGDVQFTTAGVSAVSAALRGAPLKVLFNAFTSPLHWIYARPEISSPQDLKGKRIGVDGRGGAMHYLVQDYLAKRGLEEKRGDFLSLGVGVQSDRYGALAAGAIDAAILTFPLNFVAQKAGFREVASLMKEDVVQLQGAIAFDERIRKTDPDMVEKFMRGTMKGLVYASNNRSGTITILARRLRISTDVAAAIYDLARPAMSEYGTLSEEQQNKALELIFKTQGIKEAHRADKFFDFSLAQKIRMELAAQR